MLNKIYKTNTIIAIFSFPIFASAALVVTGTILDRILFIVRETLIPLAFILALLFFFWGVAKYIRSAGSEKEEGKKIMVWGIVALFVMSSIWGIVTVLRTELEIGAGTTMPIPRISQ